MSDLKTRSHAEVQRDLAVAALEAALLVDQPWVAIKEALAKIAEIGAAPGEPSGWLPIESAPEGQDILLATDRGGIFKGGWRKGEDQWCKYGHSLPYVPCNWTHWMPLPAPPGDAT